MGLLVSEWLCVWGGGDVSICILCVNGSVCMNASKATAPHWEGEGEPELLWDQSECCFLSLLSDKETELLMIRFSSACDPGVYDGS